MLFNHDMAIYRMNSFKKEVNRMVGINVKIRPMEPEDISGILVVDRKISGVQRALTYYFC